MTRPLMPMKANAQSIQIVLSDATQVLSAAGIHDARRKARILLQHILQCGPETIIAHPTMLMDESTIALYRDLIDRCSHHEPVSKIIGKREFWGLPFKVTEDTLDPRPDSETLIEAVLEHFPERSQALRILDLGVGSGCLLTALLKEYSYAFGFGVDMSEAALSVAKENISRHGLSDRADLVASDWISAIGKTFDIVISNPPYIPNQAIGDLEPEVRCYDPPLALKGGEDGLWCYKTILEQLQTFNMAPSLLFFEIGQGQEDAIIALLTTYGFKHHQSKRDLAGITRCIVASPLATKAWDEKNV